MSAVCVLTPVVIAAWPALSSAVVAAAASLGYTVVSEGAKEVTRQREVSGPSSVKLEIDRSEVVTSQLGRDQRISVFRDGVTVEFSRDARGKAALCVTGTGQTNETLKALGEELAQAVVQQYVYQKITSELQNRGFVVVEEQQSADRSMFLRVRHWQG